MSCLDYAPVSAIDKRVKVEFSFRLHDFVIESLNRIFEAVALRVDGLHEALGHAEKSAQLKFPFLFLDI
jgi:hypothetical protein